MTDTNGNGGPLSSEEVRRFMDFVRNNERYGSVEFKTEAGKITRVKVEQNLLPKEIREMIGR